MQDFCLYFQYGINIVLLKRRIWILPPPQVYVQTESKNIRITQTGHVCTWVTKKCSVFSWRVSSLFFLLLDSGVLSAVSWLFSDWVGQGASINITDTFGILSSTCTAKNFTKIKDELLTELFDFHTVNSERGMQNTSNLPLWISGHLQGELDIFPCLLTLYCYPQNVVEVTGQ